MDMLLSTVWMDFISTLLKVERSGELIRKQVTNIFHMFHLNEGHHSGSNAAACL